MFESNDDCLDVDDEFLNEVFENEQNHFTHNNVLGFENKRTPNKPTVSQCQIRSIGQSSTLSNFKGFSVSGPYVEESITTTGTKRQIHNSDQDKPEGHLGNKENKRRSSLPHMPVRTKRERKFPGPAGLLPDRTSRGFTPVQLDSLLEHDKSQSSPTAEDLCSQGRCSGSILEEEPWQNFLADLGPDKSILNEVNVASVKRKAAAKCFVGRKVPFLAAVLHHLDVSSPDPCIILRDSTGEIHGTLHREVWEQFASELLVGSVLVVRNVGLLSTGLSSRRHYLNITANNLVTIYSANNSDSKPKNAWMQTQDFAQSIHHWRSLVSPSFGVGSPASVGSPGLFNSTVCSPFSNCSGPSPSMPSGTDSNIRKETEINKRLQNQCPKTPQGSYLNQSNLTPGSSVRNTAVGKNLMHSFSPNTFNNTQKYNNNNNSSKTFFKSVPNETRMNNNKMSGDCTKKQTTSFASSNFVQSIIKPTNSTASELFKFDPVVLETKKFSCDSFPQSNSDRQIKNKEFTKINTSLRNNKTESEIVHNNSKLVLSQSTQLTNEEQSLVESVFDGVDADSLFDDDF